MRLPSLLVLLSCFALTACWESSGLLLSRVGERKVPDGTYFWAAGPDRVRLTWKGDGSYIMMGDDGSPEIVVFDPLGAQAGKDLYAVAIASGGCAPGQTCDWDYAVAYFSGDSIILTMPDCSKAADVAMAMRRGATMKATSADTCVFHSAADLTNALFDQAATGVWTRRYDRQ